MTLLGNSSLIFRAGKSSISDIGLAAFSDTGYSDTGYSFFKFKCVHLREDSNIPLSDSFVNSKGVTISEEPCGESFYLLDSTAAVAKMGPHLPRVRLFSS